MTLDPTPFAVELHPHDPRWAERAAEEAERLSLTLGPTLLRIHHIGSTSIAGLSAKPIIDLLPVVAKLSELDSRRNHIEAIGYKWWGELGLPGRRYCTRSDLGTGKRSTQLHCYAEGSSDIVRHLAFRERLRADPALAEDYDAEKRRCQRLHPDDSHAYGDCKSAWIGQVEAAALAQFGDSWLEPEPLCVPGT